MWFRISFVGINKEKWHVMAIFRVVSRNSEVAYQGLWGFLGEEYFEPPPRAKSERAQESAPFPALFPAYLFLQPLGTQAKICPSLCLREQSPRTCLQSARAMALQYR